MEELEVWDSGETAEKVNSTGSYWKKRQPDSMTLSLQCDGSESGEMIR